MDFTSQYCAERNRLEICIWTLVSALHVRSDQLMMLIGKGHIEFMAAKAGCSEMHLKIRESKKRLLAHRAAHGC